MTTTSTTTNSTSTAASNAATSTTRTKLNANFDTFVKMLTTQLQYQDPLKPMDTTEFTNQLVLYSQVEQQLSTNDKLDELITSSKGQGVNAALGYLGWEVSSDTSNLPLQDGQGVFKINLEKAASSVTIGITDSTGKTVRGYTFEPGSKTSLDMVWDGKDSNGNTLTDGAYKISVTAKAADGTTIKATPATYGIVTGIDIDDDGNTILKMGDVSISPNSVTSVRSPTAISDTSTSTNSSSS